MLHLLASCRATDTLLSLTPRQVGRSRSCAELPQVPASRLGASIPPRRGDEQRRPHSLNYRKLLSSAGLLTLTVKCGGKLTFPPWGRPASESRGGKDGGGAAEPPPSPLAPSPDPDTQRGQSTKDATVTRTPCCRPLCEPAGMVLVPGRPKVTGGRGGREQAEQTTHRTIVWQIGFGGGGSLSE